MPAIGNQQLNACFHGIVESDIHVIAVSGISLVEASPVRHHCALALELFLPFIYNFSFRYIYIARRGINDMKRCSPIIVYKRACELECRFEDT